MPKKILVTGGAGYVGCVLVPELIARGYEVRVIDNLLFGQDGLAAVRNAIELVEGDIMRPPAGLMAGIDAVIHLGGVSSQAKAAYRSPRYTDLMNHIGTEIVGRAAKQAGVGRFILASSCSIYCSYKSAPADEAPTFTERDPVETPNPYGLSKRAAEEALHELSDGSFAVISLRKGTVYGYSPKMRYDLVLNAFTKDAFTKRAIVVNAGGEIWRPMVDIRDAVAAYIAAIELPHEKIGDGIFNVLYENQKIKDLAYAFQAALKAAKGVDITLDIRPFQQVLNYRADNRKFLDTFGLAPSRTISDAVLELWDKLERGHDYADPRFYNDQWYGQLFDQGKIGAGRNSDRG